VKVAKLDAAYSSEDATASFALKNIATDILTVFSKQNPNISPCIKAFI